MPVTRKRKQDKPTQNQRSQPARTYLEFSAITKYQALHRQWNRCAHCGKNLTVHTGHPHHVIPAQSGIAEKPADAFLRSLDNCVILCNHCYQEVNPSGNYGENVVVSPSMFKYAFGLEKNFHYQWVEKLRAEQKNRSDSTKKRATATWVN